jgi:FtsP/CotA-like multicopper oxidase with cupredoxin domain
VHLYNGLAEPTSLVISGLPSVPSPTFTSLAGSVTAVGARPAGDVTSRVRSFTTETAPGAAGTYTWSNVRPGTYLYQSGTHPAVQVQMGLYGAATKDAAAGQAYAGIPYTATVTLLYSEIDPDQHAAIVGGTFTSPIDYRPGYFLVNGAPYVPGSTPALVVQAAGEPVLVRFLNAGLETRVPMLLGGRFQVVAEDGFPYRNARSLYAPNLPAGKTLDAIATLAAGRYPIFDRRLGLSNGGGQPGGMIVELEIAP